MSFFKKPKPKPPPLPQQRPASTLYGAQADPDPFHAGPVQPVASLHAPRPGPNRHAPPKGASAPPPTGGPAHQPMQQPPHQPAQGPQHPPVAHPQSSSLNPAGVVSHPSGITANPAGVVSHPAGITANPAGVTPQSLGATPRPSRMAGLAAGVTQHPGMQGQGGQHPEEIPDWEVDDDAVFGHARQRDAQTFHNTQSALADHEALLNDLGWDEDEDEEGGGHWPEDEDDQNPNHFDPDYDEDDDPNVHYGQAI
ncbi:hypothetical protein AYO20_06875 [Fonsecaea nubica]|uniref:Uncharacterized protein n=1 Tax=Fonsecaea nubica TaxID=856822 RepID=A0A178CX76_9EURO|nr:hypothetical protein AYO20_06875 [Fonsecaea nubica]OAL33864.1 hypothetical protein AYO20_06875 [Fonsecaea nubica]